MLGYLCDELVDDPVRWESVLAEVAAAEGFDLGEVFHEQKRCSSPIPPQFLALIDALRRAEAHVVVIPAGHLSSHAVPEKFLVSRLRDAAGSRVHEVFPRPLAC